MRPQSNERRKNLKEEKIGDCREIAEEVVRELKSRSRVVRRLLREVVRRCLGSNKEVLGLWGGCRVVGDRLWGGGRKIVERLREVIWQIEEEP